MRLSAGVLFQFLDGAIKSMKAKEKFVKKYAFQFLDGTIKRVVKQSCFCCHLYFNSLMVRLKAGLFHEFCIARSLFQFLDGTIKSAGVSILTRAVRNFNSLMVRLKVFRVNYPPTLKRISIP